MGDLRCKTQINFKCITLVTLVTGLSPHHKRRWIMRGSLEKWKNGFLNDDPAQISSWRLQVIYFDCFYLWAIIEVWPLALSGWSVRWLPWTWRSRPWRTSRSPCRPPERCRPADWKSILRGKQMFYIQLLVRFRKPSLSPLYFGISRSERNMKEKSPSSPPLDVRTWIVVLI